MKLQKCANTEQHCIHVPKVYDWVTRFVNIKEKDSIKFPVDIFDDCICSNFKVACHVPSPTTIWTGLNTNHISATLSIKLNSTVGCTLDIFANGNKLGSITNNQTFNATIGCLHSIEAKCHGHKDNKKQCCCGELIIVLHYSNKCDLDFKNVKCYLSDQNGNPVDPYSPCAITCKELNEGGTRSSRQITLPNGERVTLQEVNVMKCGFITIQFFDKKGKLCKCCTLPFSEVETFHLCAPPGTRLECEITEFECKVVPQKISCECVKVFISINICQSIQMIGEVKLKVAGHICEARKEVPVNSVCPPVEFPGSSHLNQKETKNVYC